MSPDELRYVEDLGAWMEGLGSSRMGGRVWGTLLLSDATEMSGPEIAEELEVSAGSISAATRALVSLGMIERRRIPGDRKDYFAIRPDSYITLIRRREHVIEIFTDLVRRGLRIAEGRPVPTERLEEFLEFYVWLSDRFHKLIDEWFEERSSNAEA